MQHIRDGKQPFITGDGEQRRDMLHVSDAVAANIFAMEYEGKFEGQYFDTGTGSNISLNEASKVVSKYFPEVKFKYVKEREGDVLLTKAEPDSLAKLGFKTQTSIEDGVHNCFVNLLKELKGVKNGEKYESV